MKTNGKGFRYLGKSLRLLLRAGTGETLVLSIWLLALPLLGTIFLWIQKAVVDQVVHNTQHEWSREGFILLAWILAGFFALNLFQSIVEQISDTMRRLLAGKLKARMEKELMDRASRYPFRNFEDHAFYNRIQGAKNAVGDKPLSVWENLLRTAGSLVNMAVLIVILWKFSWLAVAVTIISCLPGYIYQSYFLRKNWNLVTNQIPEVRKMNYLFKLVTSKEAAKDNRLFDTSDFFIHKYEGLFRNYYRQLRQFNLSKSWASFALATLHSVGVVGIICFIYYRTAYGSISLGEMTLYVGAVNSLYNMVNNSRSFWGAFLENSYLTQPLFDFMEEEAPNASGSGEGEAKPVKGSLSFAPRAAGELTYQETRADEDRGNVQEVVVEFEGVHFSYPHSSSEVLKGISFSVREGEKVALVGENGAGKSTVIKLLLGLFEPTEGTIRIRGRDIRTCTQEEIARTLSVCFQDFYTYSFTVRENIGMGSVEKMDRMDLIQDAARKSGIEQAVHSLKDEYETYVGKEFSKTGMVFSGGQSQKLALARAFMGEGDILILDEPSAALDVETENEIFERSIRLTENRTTIFITHRLSNVLISDRILMMNDGVVSEEGSHAELIEQQGEYAELFRIQSEAYTKGSLRSIG